MMKRHPVEKAKKTWWPALFLAALLVCALGLAACGGGDDSSSVDETATTTTEPSAGGENETAAGEPIVTMTYADVDSELPPFKNILETARVYEEWVNSNGGIGGRPLKVIQCDAHGTTSGVATCGREAVSEGAVATVGSFTFTGDAIVPILEKGQTTQFGNCCPQSPLEFSSEFSFPLGNMPPMFAGMVRRAVEEGHKKINVVVVEGLEGNIPIMENAAKQLGIKIGKFVSLPVVASDYSPQVAEATSGDPEVIMLVAGEQNVIGWMPPFAQSGSQAKLYGPQGNLNENSVAGFESVSEGAVVGGTFPDISTAAWADYREALETYEADPALDYNSLGGLGTWAAYEAFKQVVESMGSEELNNETFLKAAKAAKIDLPGMLPPLNLAKDWGSTGGPKELGRIYNRCAVFSEIQEGKLVPASTEFEDVSELAGGTEPMNCGEPFEE